MPKGGPAFVYVSAHNILVQGKPAATVTAAAKTEGANWRIPKLMSALEAHEIPDDRKGEVLICAHAGADFAVIKKVLYTSGLSGYTRLSMGMVQGTPRAAGVRPTHCGSLRLRPATYASLTRDQQSPSQRLKIVVFIDTDGHTIMAGPQRLAVPRSGKDLDLARLGKRLDEIRKRLTDKQDLTVAVADGVTHAELLDTLRAALASGFVFLNVSAGGSL